MTKINLLEKEVLCPKCINLDMEIMHEYCKEGHGISPSKTECKGYKNYLLKIITE